MPSLYVSPTEPVSVVPGVVLGVGLGGLVDGIVLHQILQWHDMGSAVLPPVTPVAMRRNMAWDGWFHLGSLAVVILGVFLLLNAGRARRALPRAKRFLGQLVLGWGVFNLVEGIVDHEWLRIHHVRDLPVHVPLYDWLFLGIAGVGFILLGWLMARQGRRDRAI